MPSTPLETTYPTPPQEREDEQALAQVAHQIARADAVTAAGEAYKVEKKRLYRQHGDTLKGANEWRTSIQDMNERKRQSTQRGKILAAIEEVQEAATTRRKADQESTEDLFNDTVTKDWMP